MQALYTFVHTNSEISSCLRKKHRELLKSKWFVAWFHDNEEFFRPALFSNPDMRHLLEQFLLDMSDMILIYGFAGYYFIKNMEKWIARDPTQYLHSLPFGVIPMRSAVTSNYTSIHNKPNMYGCYVYYTNTHTMKEMIGFECSDKHLETNYSFGVFNNGAKFVPMYDGLAPISNSHSAYGDLVPVSPFTALYRKKSLIEEAIEDQYDANWALSHPQTYVTPRHIPDSKVSEISESMYYSADTLSNARHNDSAAKQLHATQSVKWLVSKLNQQAQGGKKDEAENQLRNVRKRTHCRPDQTEGIHTIAGYVDITQTHSASVIVNIDTAQNQFEEEVCNTIGLPFIFYRNDSGVTARSSGAKGGGGGHTATNEEQLNFYKTILYEEMDNVFETMNRLFGEVYSLTYRLIDIISLSTHYAEEEEKAQQKLKEKAQKTQKKSKHKSSRTEDKELHDMVIDLDAMAKNQLSTVQVVLKFEKMVARSTDSLIVLLQCYDKGIVEDSYMKKYIQLIYGKEADLIYSQEMKKGM